MTKNMLIDTPVKKYESVKVWLYPGVTHFKIRYIRDKSYAEVSAMILLTHCETGLKHDVDTVTRRMFVDGQADTYSIIKGVSVKTVSLDGEESAYLAIEPEIECRIMVELIEHVDARRD